MPSRRRAMGRKEFNLCSTPMKTGKPRLSSISISGIDTNSSSDGVRKRKVLESEISPQKRRIKRRKRAKVDLETEKENKRSKSKKAISPINYDSDWVTESEQASYVQQDSPSSDNVLFKDLSEPECVREAYHVVDDELNTSLLEPRHREDEELEKIGVEVDLPTASHHPLRIGDTDDEDEEFVSRREDGRRKYPGRQPKKPVSPKSKRTEWLIGSKWPTTLSNILWDNYMRDHPKDREMYCKISLPNSEEKKQNHANSAAEPLEKLWQDLKIPSHTNVIRGSINRQSKKWVRKEHEYGVYEFPDSEDG
ncbi:uncharacterized protein LOC128873921 isoform X1 [Hylaeus volcanicus]|uniref:uncharacterized protein LOC128873921 isoform X1 n=1 Tax=Hylaeus volcanicus TaxID=313075 RepID=UPI0023B78B8F|nr:uncharacterized protein LOC128873921 isoform X1 [Hylaeus volcanicus]